MKPTAELPRDINAPHADSKLAEFVGRKIVSFDSENGVAEATFDVPDTFLNMQGVLHGGAYATMLDTMCGIAIRTRLDMEKYVGHLTLELKVSYLRAGLPGKYRGVGSVLRIGKSIAFSQAELYDADDAQVARASGTFKLRPRKEEGKDK